MWICHCHSVTDAQIHDALGSGALDPADVGLHCGAGTRCGGCVDEIRRLCDEAHPAGVDAALPAAS